MGLAKSKGRAAGDDPFYTFQAEGCPDILLPSVTSIIKDVFSPVFQPAAYWGAKQAFQYMELHGIVEWEQGYEDFKTSEYAPNAARDKGASRGTAAHDRLEAWANGQAVGTASNGYEYAVDAWWLQQSQTYTPLLVERVTFWIPEEWTGRTGNPLDGHGVDYRLRNHSDVGFSAVPEYADDIMAVGYAGTTDLFRVTNHGRRVDGMDLKTHKPPVRFEDHLQVAAYGKAAIQMGLILEKEWTTNTIVLAKENGKFKEEERWVDPDVFTQVRSVYQAMEKGA